MEILVGNNKGGYVVSFIDKELYDDISKHKWCLKGGYVGRSVRDGNKTINIKLHRFVINAQKGDWVDHINHNKLDNRKENLRICTHSENMKNIPKNRGVSKFKGVSLDKRLKHKKWRATIRDNNVYINLGYFLTEEEAAIAYNEAAIKYHGEFACLNDIKT